MNAIKMKADRYDVVVVGGGLAGVLAAISAAREGLNVLLCERYGFLGGMATSALVNPFMSYFENGADGKLANGGLFKELRRQLFDLGAVNAIESRGVQSFNNELLKIVLDRMCRQFNVTVLFHALLSEVKASDKIESIVVSTISGNLSIEADFFIDATGNADLSAFSGLDFSLGRDEDGLCQPMTLCFRLCNVDWGRLDLQEANAIYRTFCAEKKISNPRENILVFKMPNAPKDGIMHLNTTRIVGHNPVDAFDRSRAEMIAREQVLEMFNFLKSNIAGMERCELVSIAAETGIRESRRIKGLYTLTGEDILSARRFDDSIARGTYEIDIHNPSGSGTYRKRMPDGVYYTIPYQCLVPLNSKNLLVAGRPISTTHEAHASIRIMPITACLGEAAGLAAAIAVKDKTTASEISIDKLQKMLTSYDALI